MRILLTYLLFLCVGSAMAQKGNVFDVGLKAAGDKDFRLAVRVFDSIINMEPGNTAAIVNSGNCYYQLKEYGKAVYRYETALKLDPSDEEVLGNIEACYTALGKQDSWSPAFSPLDGLIYRSGGITWGILSVAFSMLLSAGIYFRIIRKDHFIGNTLIIIVTGIFLSLSGWAGFRYHWYLEHAEHAVVVTGTSPLLLNEQGEMSGIHLTEGSRIIVLNKKKDLIETNDENGHRVYVRCSDVWLF